MTLQQIFITNLKKFRKLRGLSQMNLAKLCNTSGNYIGEIEIARRIPSFMKIEEIAKALRIPTYQLFMEDRDHIIPEKLTTRDFLMDLPHCAREDIAAHIMSQMKPCIVESLDAEHYGDQSAPQQKE
jgi:transcriptional regulator with XRE-family HTH domain